MTCPSCGHPEHADSACEVVVGYDHLNGDHDCGCDDPDPMCVCGENLSVHYSSNHSFVDAERYYADLDGQG